VAVILSLLLIVTLRTAARMLCDPTAPMYGLAVDHVAAMRFGSQTNADADGDSRS
jgi:hypothetical protein